jgi:uncharacterized protein
MTGGPAGIPGRQPPPQTKEYEAVKALNILTLILVIVGGLNWGLVGLFNFDLVATIFGAGSVVARLVYVVVGLSAIWQFWPLSSAFRAGEAAALRGHPAQ